MNEHSKFAGREIRHRKRRPFESSLLSTKANQQINEFRGGVECDQGTKSLSTDRACHPRFAKHLMHSKMYVTIWQPDQFIVVPDLFLVQQVVECAKPSYRSFQARPMTMPITRYVAHNGKAFIVWNWEEHLSLHLAIIDRSCLMRLTHHIRVVIPHPYHFDRVWVASGRIWEPAKKSNPGRGGLDWSSDAWVSIRIKYKEEEGRRGWPTIAPILFTCRCTFGA